MHCAFGLWMHSTFPSGKCQMLQQQILLLRRWQCAYQMATQSRQPILNVKYALLATGRNTDTYPPRIILTLVTFSWTHV
jgi:hypothetical protein